MAPVSTRRLGPFLFRIQTRPLSVAQGQGLPNRSAIQEAAGLFMTRLQIRLFGTDLSSFSAHSYGYELSNDPKSALNLPNFRYGPYNPTGS